LAATIALVVAGAVSRHAVASRAGIVAALVCVHGWLPLTNVYLPGGDRAEAFRAIDRGVRIIERYAPREQPKFLLTPPKKLGHFVQGLTSVYLWGYTIASDRFPAVTPAQAALITPGILVIVISEEPDAAAPFDQVFAPYRLRGVRRGSERIDTARGPIYLTFVEAAALPAA
jgi:hypothetical protein